MGLFFPGPACAGEKAPLGIAMRPQPLLMPMDYVGARAQAWMNALDEAAANLPAAASRRLADAGLYPGRPEGQAALLALASLLHPPDVITPQLSSSREIRVYLKTPADFSDFSRLFGDEETLALGAAHILETRNELAALARDWPASLEEAREEAGILEARAALLEALWQAASMYGQDRANDLATVQRLARDAPQSLFFAYLLAEALLAAGKPQECLSEANRLLEATARLEGEEKAVWKLLRPRARQLRALAQRRLNQLALAEDDLNAAIHEAQGLPARTRAQLLEARGALRLQRDNQPGMCEDYAAACRLGHCDSLARARRLGACRP